MGTENPSVASAQPRAEDVRAYVRRLIASPGFATSSRRARLLEYLSERALRGEGDAITEYAIGLDVFDKPESFDPRSESTVRAEITRLRQKLRQYYECEGADDRIRIDLPPRSYVPVFTLLEQSAAGPSEMRPNRKLPWKSRALRISGLAAAALIAICIGAHFFRPQHPGPPPLSIAILPATVTPDAQELAPLADPFVVEVMDRLATLPGLSVANWPTVSNYRGSTGLDNARRRLPFALLLATEIGRSQGGFAARFQIYRRSDRRLVWSATVPISNLQDPRSEAARVAAVSLVPIFERDLDIAAYRRSTGHSRVEPALGAAKESNTCSARIWDRVTLGRQAKVEIWSRTFGAQQRHPAMMRVAGQPSDGREIWLHAEVPAAVQAPDVVQFPTETCVRGAFVGDIPAYPGDCIRPPGGFSSFGCFYRCTPKAFPIELRQLFHDAGLWNEEAFPSGARIVDGVPFVLPNQQYRLWDADPQSSQPVSLTIPIHHAGVTHAYFLLNTVWGAPGPKSYLSLVFSGDRGTRFEKKLIGGIDIRDYNQGLYTNTINGTTSRIAFDSGSGQRMDRVEVDLPGEFASETLETITLHDTGASNFQRAILWAVTVR